MAFEGTSEHPDCRPTARVVIGGTEVPTVNGKDGEPPSVEVQMRKTGVADLTRVAEVHVPYEWGGDDVFRTVSEGIAGISTLPIGRNTGFRDIGNGPVRVDILDDVTDQYVTAFHGAVNNVGPSTIDGAFRVICTDWANYFENISFKGDFTQADVSTVLRDVTDRLQEHSGIPKFDTTIGIEDEQVANNFTFAQAIEDETSGSLDVPLVGFVMDQIDDAASGTTIKKIASEKSFHPSKHSCADVLNWVSERTSSFWYIQYNPQTGNPAITYESDPTIGPLETYNMTEDVDEQGAIRLIKNNALFQIGPQYTLEVRGEQSQRRTPREDAPFAATTVQPIAIVQHDRLATIVGDNSAPMVKHSDATSINGVEQFGKRKLKEKIDGAAGGQIITLPTGFVRPYTTIEAKPACNGRLDRSIPSITYEIEEVIHRIRHPTVDTDDGPRTILRCGIEATLDDIKVRKSREIELE